MCNSIDFSHYILATVEIFFQKSQCVTQTKLVLRQLTLRECDVLKSLASVSSISVNLLLNCLYIHFFMLKTMVSKQQFRVCVHPCTRYLMSRDTHDLCVAYLGEEHSQSALESTVMCFLCGCSDAAWCSFARTLRLAFPMAPQGSPGLWSCCCRVNFSPGVCKWIFQKG